MSDDNSLSVVVPVVAGLVGLLLGIGAVAALNSGPPPQAEDPACAPELADVEAYASQVQSRIDQGKGALERLDAAEPPGRR